MIQIHADFIGGNIQLLRRDGNTVYVERDLRDSALNWFYWAFCVEGAQGQTLTFRFEQTRRLGYWGPAFSHDLKAWRWMNEKEGDGCRFTLSKEGDSFTYTFAEDESVVYFAHHMLYHPSRFKAYIQSHGLQAEALCQSRKGRTVPMVRFGKGEKKIMLTARHHACESTGSYVLEGVLRQLLQTPVQGFEFVCIPFVDYDGVIDGDQGKSRIPHDHARDYTGESLYPETAAIRRYIAEHKVLFGFDFHSPWHIGEENDKCFMVKKSIDKLAALNDFGRILEQCMTKDAFQYRHENDIEPNTLWNEVGTPTFATCILTKPDSEIAFTLETAYYGEIGNVFSQARAIETGRCFAKAIDCYIRTHLKQ